jgi:hypothetical protein
VPSVREQQKGQSVVVENSGISGFGWVLVGVYLGLLGSVVGGYSGNPCLPLMCSFCGKSQGGSSEPLPAVRSPEMEILSGCLPIPSVMGHLGINYALGWGADPPA